MEPEGSLLYSQEPINCPVLSQINPVHVLASNFFNIHFNIILPYILRSLSSGFIPSQTFMFLDRKWADKILWTKSWQAIPDLICY
jgi:hypothetical protein